MQTWRRVFLGTASAVLFLCPLIAHARINEGSTTESQGSSAAGLQDIFCASGHGDSVTGVWYEDCVDHSGNFVPTNGSSNSESETLGTTSLPWGALYTLGITNTGSQTVSGSQTVGGAQTTGAVGTAATKGNGNASGPSSLTIVGGLVLQPTQIGSGMVATVGGGIYVSTTVPVISAFEYLASSGSAVSGGTGNLVMTATPAVSTMTVVGSANGVNLVPDGELLVLASTTTTTFTFQDNGTLSGSLLHLGASTRVVGNHKVLTLIFSQAEGYWKELSYASNN